MKKILLFLAASTFVVSCNRLAENEYEITGTVDPSLNGKNIYLEKQGGMMGSQAIDTVKIENGKFLIKGTTDEPALHFLSLEGNPMNSSKLDFVLEHGEIDLKLDKDTLFYSKRGGSYNNEKLQEYYDKIDKEVRTYTQKNQAVYMKAMQTRDTATMSRLNKELQALGKKKEEKMVDFIKNNPKAYINVYFVRQMASSPTRPIEETKKLYDALDPEIKKTKEGIETAKVFEKKNQPMNMPVPPQRPQQAPPVPTTAPAAPAQK
jgi:hypothetical protein